LLRRTYRSADIIARLGGDEFTAFPLEAGGDNAAMLVQRLGDALRRHNDEQRRPYTLSLSVGVGRFDPAKCQSVLELLDEADRELYRQKRRRQRSRR
jgi:diguanylate cyclase (GGDEF)-like protein